jgi:hypothetical protein
MLEKEEMLIIYSALELLENEGMNPMQNTLMDSAKQILLNHLNDDTITQIIQKDGEIVMRGLSHHFEEEE